MEDLAKATLGNLHTAAAMSENGGDSDQPSRSHALTDAQGTEAGSGLTGRTGPTAKVKQVYASHDLESLIVDNLLCKSDPEASSRSRGIAEASGRG